MGETTKMLSKNIHKKEDPNDVKDKNFDSDGKTKLGNDKKNKKSLEKLFCCHICGVRFTRKVIMNNHIRVHEGYRYICRVDMCYTLFKSKYSLQQHKLIHTGERPWICHVCGKDFGRKTHLLQHDIVHTGVKPYVCKVCEKTFTRRGDLTRHLTIHTCTGVRPHACEVCGKAFMRRDNLKRHLTIHARSFSCAYCGNAFSQKFKLSAHIRKCFRETSIQ